MDLFINWATIIAPILIILVFLFWFKRDLEKRAQREKEEREKELKNIHNELISEALVKLTDIAKKSLSAEKETIATDLKNKKESIENLISRIEKELEKRHLELIEARKESTGFYSEVKKQIEEHQKITKDLEASTHKLSRILSNNQVRGDWGEKILEDVLISAGLEKGIHYLTQETTVEGKKPDIIILLPEKRKINVDAKFPLQQILRMTETNDKTQINNLKKQFEKDVRTKINEIVKRGYISSQENTVDFAIMFVPNEVVFTFINKEFPSLVEEAFKKKIIIASPFSIYAIARTIMQGYKNFYHEQNLKEVLKHIENFKDNFKRFTGEFEKLGRSFDAVYKDYRQIAETRVKQLNRSFKNIESTEKSSNVKPLPQKEDPLKLVSE